MEKKATASEAIEIAAKNLIWVLRLAESDGDDYEWASERVEDHGAEMIQLISELFGLDNSDVTEAVIARTFFEYESREKREYGKEY